MKELSYDHQICKVAETVIDSTIIVGAVLGVATFLIELPNYSSSYITFPYIVDFIAITTISITAVFRKKLSLDIKALVIIIGLYLLVIFDLIKLGVYSDNKILLIIIPFYSFLLYSLRKTIVIFGIAIISLLFIGYLHYFDIIEPSANILERSGKISPWIINVILITLVSFIVVLIMRRFNLAYSGLIDELQHSNLEIAEKEENYRKIFEASTDAIFVQDLHGNILDVNNRMLEIFGYEHKDIPLLNIEHLSSGKNGYTKELAFEKVKLAIDGKEPLFDWQSKRKSGENFWVEVALTKTKIGKKDRVLAIVRDISEKKEDAIQLKLYRNHLKELVIKRTSELEQANEELLASNDKLAQQKEELLTTINELESTQKQLIHAEKMASLGVLAAGVAHEINNPLNFIQAGTTGIEQYLENKLPNDHKAIKPLLKGINEGVARAAGIVTSLNRYSRSNENTTEICDIHVIIDNCLIMLHNQLKNRVDVKKKYCIEEYTLKGNEGSLHQVILNILKNSVQAIKKKGIIDIFTKIINNNIHISIKDNGTGISKKNIGRIFDPFFTTKEAGEGTGLGLSICMKIVEEHGGKLEYRSELNKSTEAIILLPIKMANNDG